MIPEVVTGIAYPFHLASLVPGWRSAPVGSWFGAVESGFASGVHNQDGRGVAHLRPMNIDETGSIRLDTVKYVPADAGDRRLQLGDVLFNNTNSPALVGKTACYTHANAVAFSNHMTRLGDPRGCDPAFMAYQLHFLWMRGYFRSRCVNHVNQASVASSTLAETVPLIGPPLAEQRRIVAAIETHFSRLDAAVASLTRAKANVKRARASVLKAAVEGRLVPTEAALARAEGRDYEPASALLARILAERQSAWAASGARGKYKPPVPPDTAALPPLAEGWCWASCDQVGEILLGRQRAPQYLTGRFNRPYLRVANVKDDRIDFADLEQMDFDEAHFAKYRLETGDILVSEGQSPELVGQSAIYGGGYDDLCFQKTLHRFRPAGATTSAYAQAVFRAWVKNGAFMRRASITTNIAHLTLEKFKACPFPLPPIAEQQRIVAEVDTRLSVLDALDATLDANLARCARLRQSILKRAFEGRLVPAAAS